MNKKGVKCWIRAVTYDWDEIRLTVIMSRDDPAATDLVVTALDRGEKIDHWILSEPRPPVGRVQVDRLPDRYKESKT